MDPLPRELGASPDRSIPGALEADTRATLSLLETALKAVACGRSAIAVRAFSAACHRERLAGLDAPALRVRAARSVSAADGKPGARAATHLASWIFALFAVTITLPASAEPMDLDDPRARFVAVRFEVSPPDRPAQLDSIYTAPLDAWLKPGARPRQIVLTIPGRVVEERLLRGHHPVPGSFSDFVWAFDAGTGHVISAAVSGTVIRALDWGFRHSRIEARVHFRMDTLRVAGLRRERRLFGHSVHPFCVPGDRAECRAIAPSVYDQATGYVHAVGPVQVETRFQRLRTFSTLGEAIFSEIPLAAAAPTSGVIEHAARLDLR